MAPFLVGITGGIGSGKSTISKILYHLGYRIYNSDNRARELMNSDDKIRQLLIENFGKKVYNNSIINNKYLSKIIFSDSGNMSKINSIVHPEVIKDYKLWVKNNHEEKILFKESALLFESGSYKDLDLIIYVHADENLRISRVLDRDKDRTKVEIQKIMSRQMSKTDAIKLADIAISNNQKELLLPKIINVIDKIKLK